MRRTGILLLVAAALAAGCGESKLQKAVDELKKKNRVEGAYVGYGGSRSDVYAEYEKMRDVASRKELTALLDDNCPAVRVYAFMALGEKYPESDLFGLMMARLGDPATVDTLNGCIGGARQVADLMIEMIEDDLTAEQKSELVTWLLEHPNTLYARQRVLTWEELPISRHDAVRKLAEEEAEGALLALARFHEKSDVALIADKLSADSYDSLAAAEEMPDPTFWPILQRLHAEFLQADGTSRGMEQHYRAVAALKTPEAEKLLGSVLDIPKSHRFHTSHIEDAFAAAIAYREYYTDLLFRFWEASAIPHLGYEGPDEGPYTEDDLIEQLHKADPERTMRIVRAQFERSDFYNHSEFALRAMSRYLLRELKTDNAFEVINHGLAAANVHQLPVLGEFVEEHKPESSIPVLFEQLTKADNGHVQTMAVHLLLAYGRKDLRERIERLLDEGALDKSAWGPAAVREILQKTSAAK